MASRGLSGTSSPSASRVRADPTRPVTTLKTAWNNVRMKAKVKGRWHDNRHTLITDLAESGAGDQTIMDIAGHVSKQMLKHYSHIRMEAKRRRLSPSSRRTDSESQRQGSEEGRNGREKSFAGAAELGQWARPEERGEKSSKPGRG